MREGWSASIIEGYPYVRVFSAPNNDGHVTVDYKQRGYRTGISTHGLTMPAKKYAGRGWRVNLERDAMDYLHEVLYAAEDGGK